MTNLAMRWPNELWHPSSPDWNAMDFVMWNILLSKETLKRILQINYGENSEEYLSTEYYKYKLKYVAVKIWLLILFVYFPFL